MKIEYFNSQMIEWNMNHFLCEFLMSVKNCYICVCTSTFFWFLCNLLNIFWKNQFHNKLVCFCCCSSQNSFLDTFHIKNLPGRHISLIPKSMAKTCPRYASQLLLKSLPEQSTNWGLNSGSLHYAMYISHLWINFY